VTTEIERSIEAFVRERGPADTPVAARPELGRLASGLNEHWWHEAGRILARATPERALFSPEERLLLDHGVLDWRLVPGGERHRAVCLREIFAEGRPGLSYFSEWILEHLRRHALVGGMSAPGTEDSSTRLLKDLRSRLCQRLSPLFRAIPGFNQQAVDLFLSGRVDETLDALSARLRRAADEHAALQYRQLSEFRSRLLLRARERARTPDEFALFDSLREIDRDAHKRRTAPPAGVAPRRLGDEERLRWFADELRFVKQVLWLGVMGSGLARTYSLLLSAQPRLVKADVDPVLALARQGDPHLVEPASILIAPYAGGGFYEWDRDTLFLPLVPTREPEHAVLQGLASYRILLDKFQEGGAFKRDYETRFGAGADFASDFTRDYKAWVLGVGKGYKGALDPDRFAFFRDRIGPRFDLLFAPPEWAGATPREQEELLHQSRLQASTGKAGFEDHYRFAIAAWRGRQAAEAVAHLDEALKLRPVDGRALLAGGMLSARAGVRDIARTRLQDCLALAPGTIWSVYAADELRKL
jgi:hypothetical protein